MNKDAEIQDRLSRIEALRHEIRGLNGRAKAITADKKFATEQMEELLDEVKDIRDGGDGVQSTLASAGAPTPPQGSESKR